MFMQKEKTRIHSPEEQDKPPSEFIQRKSLCQLIYKKPENITTITAKQYEQAIKKHPILSGLYALVKDFYGAIFSKKSGKK